MAEKKAAAEIRIVKKGKGGHGGHHGGAWKVAYADFVTAMMAFFLVMWIVGLDSSIKSAVAGYFQDPVGFMEAVKSGKAAFSAPGVDPGSGTKGGGASSGKNVSVSSKEELKKLSEAKKTIETLIAASPEFKDLKDSIDIKIVNEGLEIDLIDGKKNLFFDSGSAKLKPATQLLLSKMSEELRKLANAIIIEGHTDARPLNRADGYTNWELSADRANSARKIMEVSGLRQNQVSQVRGYAATKPRNNDPFHFSNRRVSIIVVTNESRSSQGVASEEPLGKSEFEKPSMSPANESREKSPHESLSIPDSHETKSKAESHKPSSHETMGKPNLDKLNSHITIDPGKGPHF